MTVTAKLPGTSARESSMWLLSGDWYCLSRCRVCCSVALTLRALGCGWLIRIIFDAITTGTAAAKTGHALFKAFKTATHGFISKIDPSAPRIILSLSGGPKKGCRRNHTERKKRKLHRLPYTCLSVAFRSRQWDRLVTTALPTSLANRGDRPSLRRERQQRPKASPALLRGPPFQDGSGCQ